jgi:hypothetical protein
MRPVQREEIVDYVTWTERRDAVRPGVLAVKRDRRVELGAYLALLFENRDTVRYQVQEMMRVEHIVREADIVHELQTYNELLGRPGELGATLLIGIDDAAERDVRLRRWVGVNAHLYLRLADGAVIRPTWDPRQVGEERVSSVQYLRFDVGGRAPVAAGCDADDPELRCEIDLTAAQAAALAADLAEG